MIQTTQPSALAVRCAAENDLEGFYRNEMALRRETMFPPYARMLNLTIRGLDEEKVRKATEELSQKAEETAVKYERLEVFPAMPCLIEKRARYYRYHVLLRSESVADVLLAGAEILHQFKVPHGLYLEIDMDPLSLT